LLGPFREAKHVELRAIASRSLERAQAAAREADIPVAYGSYQSLLDDPNIDAVYIPLPNGLHGEWTIRAAEHGKHVLCEKPLTSDYAEAERVYAVCQQHKVVLMDGFMWPHHPRTARLRQELDSGLIGEIRRVHSVFTFHLDRGPSDIRLQADLAGGSLMDVGCYPIYGSRWVFGAEPTRVYAVGDLKNGVDLSASALLEFSNGRVAQIASGFTLPFQGTMEIVGTEGIVRVPDMWLPPSRATYEVWRNNQMLEEVAIDAEDQIVHMIQNFSLAVIEGRTLDTLARHAVANMRVLDSLRLSARERRVVDLRG
jgi:predicted dehydrogenase